GGRTGGGCCNFRRRRDFPPVALSGLREPAAETFVLLSKPAFPGAGADESPRTKVARPAGRCAARAVARPLFCHPNATGHRKPYKCVGIAAARVSNLVSSSARLHGSKPSTVQPFFARLRPCRFHRPMTRHLADEDRNMAGPGNRAGGGRARADRAQTAPRAAGPLARPRVRPGPRPFTRAGALALRPPVPGIVLRRRPGIESPDRPARPAAPRLRRLWTAQPASPN